MGMCGCAETPPSYRLVGPGGVVYTLTLYHSCRYCETPTGIIVQRISSKEDRLLFDVDALPEPDWDQWPDASVYIPLFDPEVLKERLVAFGTGWDDEDVDAEALPFIMDDAVDEVVHRQGPLLREEEEGPSD